MEIPENVKKIDLGAFKESGIKFLVLPDNITNIGTSAFERCRNLERIMLPNSLSSLGRDAFTDCSSLQSIVLPDSLTVIPYACFYGCSALSEVVMSDNVVEICGLAFYDCAISGISLSNNLRILRERAFMKCKYLTKISLPVSLRRIENTVFGSVPLKNVYYDYENGNDWKLTFANTAYPYEAYNYKEQLSESSIMANYLVSTYSYYVWVAQV